MTKPKTETLIEFFGTIIDSLRENDLSDVQREKIEEFFDYYRSKNSVYTAEEMKIWTLGWFVYEKIGKMKK